MQIGNWDSGYQEDCVQVGVLYVRMYYFVHESMGFALPNCQKDSIVLRKEKPDMLFQWLKRIKHIFQQRAAPHQVPASRHTRVKQGLQQSSQSMQPNAVLPGQSRRRAKPRKPQTQPVSMQPLDEIQMICVDETNHNKFYNMINIGNGTFRAEWGRVGASAQSKEYPIEQWDAKMQSKLKKGYAILQKSGDSMQKKNDIHIDDPDVYSLIDFLLKTAKKQISASYQVGVGDISREQVSTAQALVDKAYITLKSGEHTQSSLNALLKELYTVIPRRMSDTRKYFLQETYEESFVTELLQNEQSLLEMLETQIKIEPETITLESLGIAIEPASKDDRKLIAKKTDFKVKSQRIFKVSNRKTEAAFLQGGDTKLLYHGTRNCNWLAVLQQGLKIRPKGVQTTGSMFGDAIYFANKARKSIGYTSLKGSYWAGGSESVGYLAVFEVNTGREWNLLKNRQHEGWMTRLTQQQVSQEGYDTVFAQGGADLRNDEYIIYDSSRCTIRYLIELG